MTSPKEWIDNKIKNEVIIYFEYDKFSNIEEIGRGGYSKVSKADLADMGYEVALKSYIYKENDIDRLNELVKEVRIAFFTYCTLALYIKFIVIHFILLLVKASSFTPIYVNFWE